MSKQIKNKGVLLSKVELANNFGITRPTIDDWVRAGCPVVQKGSRRIPWQFNSADVYEWRLKQLEQTLDDDKGPTINELRKERLAIDVEHSKIVLGKEKEEILSRSLTQEFSMKIMMEIKTRIMRLPAEVVPKMDLKRRKSDKTVVLQDAIRSIFDEVIKQGDLILGELHEDI